MYSSFARAAIPANGKIRDFLAMKAPPRPTPPKRKWSTSQPVFNVSSAISSYGNTIHPIITGIYIQRRRFSVLVGFLEIHNFFNPVEHTTVEKKQQQQGGKICEWGWETKKKKKKNKKTGRKSVTRDDARREICRYKTTTVKICFQCSKIRESETSAVKVSSSALFSIALLPEPTELRAKKQKREEKERERERKEKNRNKWSKKKREENFFRIIIITDPTYSRGWVTRTKKSRWKASARGGVMRPPSFFTSAQPHRPVAQLGSMHVWVVSYK